jgi:hypothetical protein
MTPNIPQTPTRPTHPSRKFTLLNRRTSYNRRKHVCLVRLDLPRLWQGSNATFRIHPRTCHHIRILARVGIGIGIGIGIRIRIRTRLMG